MASRHEQVQVAVAVEVVAAEVRARLSDSACRMNWTWTQTGVCVGCLPLRIAFLSLLSAYPNSHRRVRRARRREARRGRGGLELRNVHEHQLGQTHALQPVQHAARVAHRRGPTRGRRRWLQGGIKTKRSAQIPEPTWESSDGCGSNPHAVPSPSFRSPRAFLRRRPQELEGDDDLQEKLRRRKEFDDNDEDMYGWIKLRAWIRAFQGGARALCVCRAGYGGVCGRELLAVGIVLELSTFKGTRRIGERRSRGRKGLTVASRPPGRMGCCVGGLRQV
jgi:hypothetical protein